MAAEQGALLSLAGRTEIKGFRTGKAPSDKVRERVGAERVLEETVRFLLPSVLKEALEKSGAKPMLRPAASVASTDPLTIELTFVERPTVSVKKPNSVKVEKKTIAEATTDDVDAFVKKILLQDKNEDLLPELTQEYLKSRLGSGVTPDAFRSDVKKMITDRKRSEELQRREEELYDNVRAATTVDLAPEIIDAEVEDMAADLRSRLKQQGMTMDDWLKSSGKEASAVIGEMKGIAESRIKLRFGMQELASKLGIEAAPDAIASAITSAKAAAKKDGCDRAENETEPGGTLYEHIRFDLTMQALVQKMIGGEK